MKATLSSKALTLKFNIQKLDKRTDFKNTEQLEKLFLRHFNSTCHKLYKLLNKMKFTAPS